MQIKLSQWAKKRGVSYQTALKWIHNGKFPDSFTRMDTGTILVDSEDDNSLESENRKLRSKIVRKEKQIAVLKKELSDLKKEKGVPKTRKVRPSSLNLFAIKMA